VPELLDKTGPEHLPQVSGGKRADAELESLSEADEDGVDSLDGDELHDVDDDIDALDDEKARSTVVLGRMHAGRPSCDWRGAAARVAARSGGTSHPLELLYFLSASTSELGSSVVIAARRVGASRPVPTLSLRASRPRRGGEGRLCEQRRHLREKYWGRGRMLRRRPPASACARRWRATSLLRAGPGHRR